MLGSSAAFEGHWNAYLGSQSLQQVTRLHFQGCRHPHQPLRRLSSEKLQCIACKKTEDVVTENRYCCEDAGSQILGLFLAGGNRCVLWMSREIAHSDLLTNSHVLSIWAVPDTAECASIDDVLVGDVEMILRVSFSRDSGDRFTLPDPDQ